VLEREEHLREVALKEELLRQEKLEQLAFKFERKSVLREGYLNEMIQVKNQYFILGFTQFSCFLNICLMFEIFKNKLYERWHKNKHIFFT
jgi:hypothetical protein